MKHRVSIHILVLAALVLIFVVGYDHATVRSVANTVRSAAERSSPPAFSSAATFSVAQVQAGLRQSLRAWLGRTVRVRANVVALCSFPNSYGVSMCKPGHYPGEPAFGLVDDDTGDQDRALQRSLPLLLNDFIVARRPQPSPLHNLVALARTVPGLGRFVPASTDLIPPEASGLTYLDLEETPVFIVRLVVETPCATERLMSPCYAGNLMGLS